MNSPAKKIGLKSRILLPLALVLAALLGLFLYSTYLHEKNSLNNDIREHMQSAQAYFQDAIRRRSRKLGVGLEIILQDEKLQAALRAKDRTALLKRSEPIYRKLHAQYGITHFYFEDATRVNVLRVHQPERYGDVINRFTTLTAEKTGKLFVGTELGPIGTLTLRAVAPMFDRAGLVGYIELGEEIEDILHEVKNILGADNLTMIDKQFLTREDWESGMRMLKRNANWEQLPDAVITHQDTQIPGNILTTLTQISAGEFVANLNMNGKQYYAGAVPLKDVAGKKVGKLIVLHDMAPEIRAMRNTLISISQISIALSIGLFVMFYVITGRVERRLIAQGDELRHLNETLEKRIQEEVSQNRAKDLLLIQQSRLAAMGEMIHNIAHQWRQPLSLVGVIAQNIALDFEEQTLTAATMEEYTAKMMRTVQQMSTTIDDFCNFLKPDQQRSQFSLENAVREVLDLLEASFKHNQISISVEIKRNSSVTGFPHEFCQVLINVLTNAKDAIQNRKVPDGRIAISMDGDQKKAWIMIRDNGGGIPEDVLPKIFDPYFTTKEKGTGIGLYMSKMILQHMNGTLEVHNVGEGSEFRITLPIPSQ